MLNQFKWQEAVARVLPFSFGKIFLVVSSSDSWASHAINQFGPDADGVVRIFTSLADAYAATVSGRNDVIILDSNTTHSLSGMLTVSKSRVNFVSVDWLLGAHRLVQQGAKVQISGAVDAAAVLKVTGVRCSFRGIKFIQASTHANALNVVQFGGEGTYYEDCSFTFGVADNLDLTTASEALMGEDSGTFLNCQFGVDTLLTSAARSVMTVDQVNGFEFKSNRFRGCTFLISSSEAGAQFITLAAAGDILFSNLFEECTFVASIDSAGGVALTKAVSTPNGTSKGTLYFRNPVVFGAANFGVNGTNNDNIQVYGAANTGTDLHGIAPIAT